MTHPMTASEARRLLIVDDDAIDRATIRRALSRTDLNLSVQDAEDGATAVALYRDRPFDIVLLDYQLPDGTGLEVLRTMLSLRDPLCVVIALTGLADKQGAIQMLSTGALDCLHKDELSPSALARAISYAEVRRRSEAKFRTLVASSNDPILVVDPAGLISYANATAERLFGRGNDEVIGRPIADLVTGDPFSGGELTCRGPEERIVEASATRLEWDGVPSHIISLRDVTERNRATRALRESECRVRALLDTIGQAVMVHRGLRPLFVNRAFADMFGFPAVDAVFRRPDLADRFPEEAQSRLLEHCEHLTTGARGSAIAEVRGRRIDGTEMSLELRLVPLPWGGGPAVCSMIDDVGKRREREQRALQAQRMESIGELTGGVAHDFNNLLTIIIGNLELIADGGDPAEIAASLEASRRAADKGAELVRRLLAFARQQVLDPKVVDINAVVSGMEELLRRSLSDSIALALTLAPDLPPVLIDAGQLENSLINLAVNARDAMPDGGRLVVETSRREVEEADSPDGAVGSYVEIAVTDTGTGIPETIRGRIFEPYFTTKPEGKGTGLGLSGVYGFVRQSGGQVSVHSEPARGTTIRLLIPASAGPAAGNGAPATDPVAAAQGRTVVLVVEDNPAVRAVAVSLLERLGYETLEAPDGPTALRIAETRPDIDCVFTDVVMPGGLSGPDLVERIRQIRPEVTVVYSSGYASGVFAAERARSDAWLAKPYTRRRLAEVLEQAFAGRRTRGDGDRH